MRTTVSISEEPGERPIVPAFGAGTGPRPGIDLSSNRSLQEALDEGLELDTRR
jgi:hypothetical protein